ncbi:major capsid protein [Dipodfec virus UOA04_Rod_962]|nr:major capsid protein [Dipodfec virus UOA04_Rod_962]
MRRYKHNRSNTRIQTQDMGFICPTGCRHVLHGTTVRGGIGSVMRLKPLVNPIYSEIDVMNWIIGVPDRVLWEDYENFVTGGQSGEERPEPPYIVAPAEGWAVGSLADYLGEPTGVPYYKSSALPFRAYAMWINENILNPQLQPLLPVSFASGEDKITNTTLQRINWQKDLFTTLTSEPQLGDDVIVPIAANAPVTGHIGVYGNGKVIGLTNSTVKNNVPNGMLASSSSGDGAAVSAYDLLNNSNSTGSYGSWLQGHWGLSTSDRYSGIEASSSQLNADLTQSTGVSVSSIKMAFSRQAWKIKRNLYGSAYKDLLSFLGIRYSDARLQLPQTFAYGKSRVDISEVLQTAPGTDSYVGNMAGRGTSFNRSSSCKVYFEESTTVIFLSCLRPKTIYVNIPNLDFNFKVREDIYTPEFAHVGMVPYYRGDLHPVGSDSDNEVLGYGNIYDSQRVAFNTVAGQFKTVDASYHLGRMFENQPALNSDFLQCNPTNRVFADMTNTQHIEVFTRHKWNEKSIVSKNGDPKFNL